MTHDPTDRASNRNLLLCAGLALALAATSLPGAEKSPANGAGPRGYPPVLPGASVETYKIVGQTNLQLYIFTPKTPAPTNGRPAILFFFGGGWTTGSPQQFGKHCQYL